MKACKDIDFLDSYWAEAKRIATDIKENLAVGCGNERKPIFSSGSAKMYVVKFSDLKDSWSPKDIFYNICGKSNTLDVLADKLQTMILKGRGEAVKRTVEAICNNKVKKLTRRYCNGKLDGEFLGYGHFKWNNQAYTLNEMEIRHLKKYFKL